MVMDKLLFLTGPRYHGNRSFLVVMILCLVVIAPQVSCTKNPPDHKEIGNGSISRIYTREPFTVKLQTNTGKITIADQLELVLEATVPENTEVEFPSYAAALGDFTLKDSRIAPVRMTGSKDGVRVIHQATYILTPYLAGDYTIPAMTVIFRNGKNDETVALITTEKIEIGVASLLPANTDNVSIRDIKPPVSMPPDRIQQLLAGSLIFLFSALVIAGLLYWKKKSGRKLPAAALPGPDEIALQKLELLLADDLLAREEIMLFHRRISDILRHYIENRFGLKAPERTTEEFLLELFRTDSSENALLGGHKSLLADFLTQCDLVKFARHKPTVAESEKTIFICREFIEKTKKIED